MFGGTFSRLGRRGDITRQNDALAQMAASTAAAANAQNATDLAQQRQLSPTPLPISLPIFCAPNLMASLQRKTAGGTRELSLANWRFGAANLARIETASAWW